MNEIQCWWGAKSAVYGTGRGAYHPNLFNIFLSKRVRVLFVRTSGHL